MSRFDQITPSEILAEINEILRELWDSDKVLIPEEAAEILFFDKKQRKLMLVAERAIAKMMKL